MVMQLNIKEKSFGFVVQCSSKSLGEIMESYAIGTVLQCRHGRLGVVVRKDIEVMQTTREKRVTYIGIGFDGKPWQSVFPTFIAKNIDDYVAQTQSNW